MQAWVVREDRHGEPVKAMLLETVPVPEPRVGEVIVQVKAAGINYNHLWACRGKPVPISALHPDDPMHIGGSDAAGVVAAVGPGVKYWKVGDEVITHPNQSCGQCAACNGFEPLSCLHQKAWGFETSWGSFGQYARVQAQQLLRKPPRLSWEAAACYGLKLFTAYRMLFVSTQIKPDDRVLIWGASGGLGSYAIQLCRAVNATPICVVSSAEKEAYCRSLGAELFLDRREFGYLADKNPSPVPNEGMRNFRRKLRALTGGYDPDIVFEHVGAQTFPTSLFVARRLGKVVICGATSGFALTFDARYLWMYQKSIVGSHGCNQHDATRATHLVEKGVIEPTLTRTFDFGDAAVAHQRLLEDGTSHGSMAIRVDA
jgi:crotonyl-CoA carboxylase/reductase